MISTRDKKIKHVCYLMDGTRTYQAFKKTSHEEINKKAYYSGMRKLHKIMDMSFRVFDIDFLTVNIIGRQNTIDREDSATALANIFPYFFLEEWKEYLIKNRIRVKFIGDLDLFCNSTTDPNRIKQTLIETEKYTEKFHDHNLILMVAYEPSYEYLEMIRKKVKAENKEDLIMQHYGFHVPDVNIIIRTWRPKFSGCIPLFVSEYADIYFFPAPFIYFNKSTYKKIIDDYIKRIESSNKVPTTKQIKKLYEVRKKISKKPLLIGKLVGDRWLPIHSK